MPTTVNLSVKTEDEFEDLEKFVSNAVFEALQAIDVEAEIKTGLSRGSRNGYTKGRHIYDLISECVETGNYITRGVIAETARATVSRVSEVLRDMEESEDENVVAIQDGYRALAKADRRAKRLAKQLEEIDKRKKKAEARIAGASSKDAIVNEDENVDDD